MYVYIPDIHLRNQTLCFIPHFFYVPYYSCPYPYYVNSVTRNEGYRQKVQIGYIHGDNVPIWKLPNKNGFFFVSKMAVDADGSPRAYHPQNKGLDDLKNAGRPGNWYGILTHNGKPNGRPLIQKQTDPAPGYYISPTALVDASKERTNPKAYVNSEEIPYFVLPPNNPTGAQLGDYGVAINLLNNKLSYAIFADIGPRNKIGEGSIALAENLGINPDPRKGGTEKKNIFYLVFPKSGKGNGYIPNLDEINNKGEQLLTEWGGLEQVKSVINNRNDYSNLNYK